MKHISIEKIPIVALNFSFRGRLSEDNEIAALPPI
jgi:hypothetical protein